MTVSALRRLSSLSGPWSVFLACTMIGAVVAAIGVSAPNTGIDGEIFAIFMFGIWLCLGLLFGGIVWILSTVSMWRQSLAARSLDQRDPALELLRERYARGELDEAQFEAMLNRLKGS